MGEFFAVSDDDACTTCTLGKTGTRTCIHRETDTRTDPIVLHTYTYIHGNYNDNDMCHNDERSGGRPRLCLQHHVTYTTIRKTMTSASLAYKLFHQLTTKLFWNPRDDHRKEMAACDSCPAFAAFMTELTTLATNDNNKKTQPKFRGRSRVHWCSVGK